MEEVPRTWAVPGVVLVSGAQSAGGRVGRHFCHCLRRTRGLQLAAFIAARKRANVARDMRPFYESIPPPAIPDHELIRRIGEGSYGEIWLARTVMGLYRAVKIIYRARFEEDRPYEREFQGIQRFEPISRGHPGLVDILQIGRNDAAGYFYYIMELADDLDASRPFDPASYSAKTLGRHLTGHVRLPAAEALDLGRSLAAALAHLHASGLVHRDIKPSNIIFVNAEPKLADIGLVAPVTAGSSYVGTEGYIPPEGPGAVQADIYSLGMVLYQMSTGQDRLAFPALPAGLDQFSDGELVAELNEVIVKACAPKPESRHQTAEELRGELDLLLGGRSVRRLRVAERQLATLKRVAWLATGLAIVALFYSLVTNHLRAREEKLLVRAYITEGARAVETGNLHGALPALAEALRLQQRDRDAAETARVRLGTVRQQSPRLWQSWDDGGPLTDVRFSADGRRLLVAGGRRARIVDLETFATLDEYPVPGAIETAVFSPDERAIAITHKKDSVTVVEVATRTNRFTFRAPAHVNSAEFSPDSQRLVVASADSGGFILNARDGAWEGQLDGHGQGFWYAVFSPDGRLIVTAGKDGQARLWNAQTTEEISPPFVHAEWIHAAAFSPDGRQIVTASSDHTLRVWHTNGTLAVSASMNHRAAVRRVSYSPDGRQILSAGWDQTVRVWDARTGRPAGATLNLHTAAMQAVFDADARRVATAGAGGEIKIWEMRPDAPKNLGSHALFSGNGAHYVTLVSNALRFWNAADDAPRSRPQAVHGEVLKLLCNDAGTRALALTLDVESGATMARVFDADGDSARTFSITNAERWWLNASGTRLLTGHKRTLFYWNTDTGGLIFSNVAPMTVHLAALAPDGKFIVAGGHNSSRILQLDAETGAERRTWELATNLQTLALSPDGRRLAAAGNTELNPGAAQLWDTGTGERLGKPMPHANTLVELQFSHRSQLLATASRDQRAVVWNAQDGTPVLEPIPLPSYVRSVAFSRDDRWLLTMLKQEVQVWDAATGQPVTPPFTDAADFSRAGFCAGGQRLWVASARGLLVWNLPRESGTPAELIALAEQLGVTVPAALRQKKSATAVTRANTSLEVWQREQAELCEAGGDWFAAQFHLEKLLRTAPNDAALRARLETAREHLK